MMALAGLQGPVSAFLPEKTPASEAAPSIAVMTALVVAPIVIIVLVILLVVFVTRKKTPSGNTTSSARGNGRK